jgi:hypothetical protein
MVIWPPPETRLSLAGHEFINNPTRNDGGAISRNYWRTVTEIYLRIKHEIESTRNDGDLFEWFDLIFVNSFTDWDRERQDNHRHRYRQRWRHAIGQEFRLEGTHANNPFCTGGSPAGQLGGEWIPIIVIEEEREGLIQRTAPYVCAPGVNEAYIPPHFPQSNLPMNGETMVNRSNSPEGWIYILTHPSFDGWVKIGKTRNLASRLSAYNVGTPNTDQHYVIERHFPENHIPHPNALGIEQTIHNLQAADRLPGQSSEWYQWTIEEAADQIHDMIEYLGTQTFEELNQQAVLENANDDNE